MTANDKTQMSESADLPAEECSKFLGTDKDILLRGLAHDVNNNLMAILAGCDQLEKSGTEPEEKQKVLETIRNHITLASRLVNDLTRDSTSEDNQVIMTQFELENLLRGIIPSLSLVTSNTVTIEIGSIITSPVFINPVLLHRILLQFVRNAMETGCDNIIIYISVRQHDGWCELSISNNGPGIKGVLLDKVFSPGVSTKTDHNRRGFGLSSVAHAVDRWGGKYGVENLSGQGCRFWITFPLLELNVAKDLPAGE